MAVPRLLVWPSCPCLRRLECPCLEFLHPEPKVWTRINRLSALVTAFSLTLCIFINIMERRLQLSFFSSI